MTEATIETDAQPLEPSRLLHVPPIPNDFAFNKLLLEIGKCISGDVLGKIKFQYRGELKASVSEKIKNSEDLFTIFLRRRYISPENMFHLQRIVMMIDDADVEVKLMRRIYEYSRDYKAVFFRRITDEKPTGFKRVQFHVEGLEHFQFDKEAANKLRNAVASLTGIDMRDVLVDGIQQANSIYVTLLIPDRHYILFSSLLKNGIPLLTELNIDMVTFEDGTTMKSSNGSQIVEELPPIRESPDETIERLKEELDELDIENIDYRERIEKASGDLKAISRQLEESTNETIEKHANRQLLQSIVSLNRRLVKGLGSEKMRTKHKQPELLEHKHTGMLETRKPEDVEENTGVKSNDPTVNREKETTVGDETDMETTKTCTRDQKDDETSRRNETTVSDDRKPTGISTPELNELLQKFDAMITQNEKKTLRTKFPSTNGCTDDELLSEIVCDNFQKFTGQSEELIEFMKELFTSIKRDVLLEEFRREYYQLRHGLRPEIQEHLRETSSKLSKPKKKRLRRSLIDQSRGIEENDVLECLVLEQFNGFMTQPGQLDGYIKSKLDDHDEQDLMKSSLRGLTNGI